MRSEMNERENNGGLGVVSKSEYLCWTLEEAAEFSRIGINRMRRLTSDKHCPFVLWVGETKRLVKVEPFKQWLNDAFSVA